MFSRSLIRFATIAQARTRLEHKSLPSTITFHSAARPSTIENVRYLSFSAVKPQKILFDKTSIFRDREMSVELRHSEEQGYNLFVCGTSSYIFLSTKQAKDLLYVLQDAREQVGTLVNVDAIPAFTDILQSAVDEYNKIKSKTRDEPVQA